MNRTWCVFRTVAAGALTLGLVVASSAAFAAVQRDSLSNYGALAPGGIAERTVVLGPDARSANVTNGETVKFVVKRSDGSEQSFAWRFDLFPTQTTVDLSEIAPAGVLDHDIRVYVAPDPHYSGG